MSLPSGPISAGRAAAVLENSCSITHMFETQCRLNRQYQRHDFEEVYTASLRRRDRSSTQQAAHAMHVVDDTSSAERLGLEGLTSKAMKARMGDRSIVPFNGGMMPLNKFRYGSHRVLHTQSSFVNAF